MKIIRYKFICPKCKKEYYNSMLASYSSGFEDAAKEFTENNKTITHCEECNTQLVPESLICNYDENGNYNPKPTNFKIKYDAFDLYLKVLETIKSFFSCIPKGQIILEGKTKDGLGSIATEIVIIGKNDDQEYKLLFATINEFTTQFGDRKNRFIKSNMIEEVNSLIKTIIKYMHDDDCSPFFNKEVSNISYKLVNE